MPRQSGRLFSLCLAGLRLILPAWVGAAVLFVLTSVAEQTSPNFESVVRDQLATIRFPFYYAFGFTVHIAGFICALGAWKLCEKIHRKRICLVLALVSVSFLAIVLDYCLIYTPLQAAITPPGKARTAEFIQLHTWSRHANEVHLLLILLAAVIVVWPLRYRTSDASN